MSTGGQKWEWGSMSGEGVGVRECVREGVSQGESEAGWEWEWGREGVSQGGREENLSKNHQRFPQNSGSKKLDWFHCTSCACSLICFCEDSFYCILYHFLCLWCTPTCSMLYSDMITIPVLSISQWSRHVCACMYRNEMFSNWEKSREGKSNGKMRRREEKRRGRKGWGRREWITEEGRETERGKKREKKGGVGMENWRKAQTTDLTGYPAPQICTCIV